jgi:DNA-nicking Smr family endonuclease
LVSIRGFHVYSFSQADPMPPAPDDEPVRIPITGELDLHTFRPQEIASLLDAYLAECALIGRLDVRVIHGKGTGTLRETVHAWLRRSPRVAAFRLGDEHSGSWGATLVTLKAPPPGGRAP